MSGQIPLNHTTTTTGHPVQIINITKEHKFKLDEDALHAILSNPKAKNKKVCVVSVTGAFRNGKSFLLDFFLRYLNRNCKEDWIGTDDEPLTGFYWQCGPELVTTGILMWSEPFILKRNNEDVAVLLMDTQGAFSSQSTVMDCATVFALSSVISSIHIYNVMEDLQVGDLQHLHLSAEFAKMALKYSNETTLQRLTFLIRDWCYPYEYPYGYDGGNRLLEKRFKYKEEQQIKKCFKTLNCYLMPHPGLKVCTSPEFDGKLKDIEVSFKAYVQKFIEDTFTSNFTIKQINGREITTYELFEYFKVYCRVFEADELPEPKSIAEANNLAAKSISKNFFIKAMEQLCGDNRPYKHPQHLKEANTQIKKESIKNFKAKRKNGL